MIPKPRAVGGRTRVTPRHERRPPAAVMTEEARFGEAQRVASRFVAAHWPELAGVAPVATARHTCAPTPELLARLGLSGADLAAPGAAEYTFTFAGEQHTVDHATTPLVANITVDAHFRVVKTSVSR